MINIGNTMPGHVTESSDGGAQSYKSGQQALEVILYWLRYCMLGANQCPLCGVERCLFFGGSKCISSMVSGQVIWSLSRDCPLSGGSVVRDVTVLHASR